MGIAGETQRRIEALRGGWSRVGRNRPPVRARHARRPPAWGQVVSASTNTVLDRILGETRAELERRKHRLPTAQLQARALTGPEPRGFQAALLGPGVAVIAEFKRRSPSAGALREQPDLHAIVDAYRLGGASALSVLTEGPNFYGSLDDLAAARARCALPVLRKDFVVDPYQLHEARAAGADAVLLIVAALPQGELVALHGLARELGLDVLAEVHDPSELDRALDAGAELIGVNNRDLRDFSVDMRRTFALLEHMPQQATVVSESGIAAPHQLRELGEAGVDAVLVGEALMRSADPERALASLLEFF
jgi:indole-3-glycerol phosphate synthase